MAENKTGVQMETEEEQLKAFVISWDEVMLTNDAVEIGKFMAEDWVIVGSDGITSKSSFLQSITSGSVTHNRMDSELIEVKIYENTGIIINRGTSAGTYNNKNFSLYEWSTSVFIKKDAQWVCVLTMLTPATKTSE